MLVGLWRRLLADAVDAIILVGLGGRFLRYFGHFLLPYGENQVWIGALVTFFAIVLPLSFLNNGQTVGKKMLKIQVMGLDGNPLGVGRSLLRASFLALLFYNEAVDLSSLSSVAIMIDSAICLAFFFGTFLMIPFHPLKQGIHDLLAGSVVIRKDTFDAAALARLRDNARASQVYSVLAIGCVLTFAVGLFGTEYRQAHAGGKDLSALPALITANSEFQNVAVAEFPTRTAAEIAKITDPNDPNYGQRYHMVIHGYLLPGLYTNVDSRLMQVRKAYDALLKQPANLKGIDRVTIIPRTGVNIGIAALHYYTSLEFRPDPFTVSSGEVYRSTGPAIEPAVAARYVLVPGSNSSPLTAEELYDQKAFGKIESYFAQELVRKPKTPYTPMLDALNKLTYIKDVKDAPMMRAVLDQWVQGHPGSHVPWLIRGTFEINGAWSIRGGGYSNEVRGQAWKLFFNRLKTAQSDLETSQRLAPQDPLPALELIGVARSLQFPRAAIEKYYDECIKAWPPLQEARYQKLEYLKAKWYGSDEKMFAYARGCLSLSKKNPILGLVLVHAYLQKNYDYGEAANYLARPEVWADISSIYARIFPVVQGDIVYRENYVWMAYEAKKYDVAAEQFDAIGDQYTPSSYWGSLANYNQARAYTYQQIAWNDLEHDKDNLGIPMLFKSYTYNPHSPWILTKLAQLSQRQGDYAKAKEYAQSALANFPVAYDAQLAQSVLADAQKHLKP
jgi:uncharacterized RDD family membrane protein YckC